MTKYKIGDRVVVTKVIKVFNHDSWGELVGREFIVTDISRTKGLPNSYSLTERETELGYAWVYEPQMELSSNLSKYDIKECVDTYNDYMEEKKGKDKERHLEMVELVKKAKTPEEQKVLMNIFFPFQMAIFTSAKKTLSDMKRGKLNDTIR